MQRSHAGNKDKKINFLFFFCVHLSVISCATESLLILLVHWGKTCLPLTTKYSFSLFPCTVTQSQNFFFFLICIIFFSSSFQVSLKPQVVDLIIKKQIFFFSLYTFILVLFAVRFLLSLLIIHLYLDIEENVSLQQQERQERETGQYASGECYALLAVLVFFFLIGPFKNDVTSYPASEAFYVTVHFFIYISLLSQIYWSSKKA